VTDTVAIPIETIAGKVDMSRQLFDRSQPGMDEVIMADLASAYGLAVDSEIINGPGSGGRVKGLLTAAASNTIAVSTLTVPGTYPKIADAIQRVDTQRYLPATLAVFHPRRWGQWLAGLDTSSRPFVVPAPVAFNPSAVGQPGGIVNSQGYVGYEVQGLPVIKDPNIPTNLGAGTNEDRIIITRREDLLFMESGAPVVRAFEEVLSGTLQVRVQAFGYIAFTAERVSGAISTWLLTGLTTPSF
jgi:HK97 family phage major capsid protein